MRPVEELRYLILAVQREGSRRLAAELRPLGLTPSQAEVLGVLAEHQPLSLGGLGELLVCETGTNPSRIVDRLVSGGLVGRETDPDDRRQVLLSLTDEGHELAKRVATAEARLEETLEELIGDQPTGPAIDLLWSIAAHFPTGQALHRRRTMTSSSAARTK
jgi:DNA-binding MarR family transcriptional regulator